MPVQMRRFVTAALLLAVMAFSVFGPARGQERKAEPAPARTDEKTEATASLGTEYEEEVARTREELENTRVWLNAKRAQLKAAEMSSQIEHKFQGEYDRLLKKGMTSSLRREVADLEFLESEAQRALIQAEISDLELKFNRTRRYLARLEKLGTAAIKAPEDHALELTEVQTRLKYAERLIVKLQEELKDTRVELEKVTRKSP
jgi:hypothetical protein